jgi:hypothetical protein
MRLSPKRIRPPALQASEPAPGDGAAPAAVGPELTGVVEILVVELPILPLAGVARQLQPVAPPDQVSDGGVQGIGGIRAGGNPDSGRLLETGDVGGDDSRARIEGDGGIHSGGNEDRRVVLLQPQPFRLETLHHSGPADREFPGAAISVERESVEAEAVLASEDRVGRQAPGESLPGGAASPSAYRNRSAPPVSPFGRTHAAVEQHLIEGVGPHANPAALLTQVAATQQGARTPPARRDRDSIDVVAKRARPRTANTQVTLVQRDHPRLQRQEIGDPVDRELGQIPRVGHGAGCILRLAGLSPGLGLEESGDDKDQGASHEAGQGVARQSAHGARWESS